MPTKKSKTHAPKATVTAVKKPTPKKPAGRASQVKKTVVKKPGAKKSVAKKPVAKKSAAKKPAVKQTATRKPAAKKVASKKLVVEESEVPPPEPRKISATMQTFFKRQEGKLLGLKDTLLDSLTGMAKHTLRAGAEGGEASAFGMHQADAGSDAYDRDFALSLLSQEQDSLFEIDEALNRIKVGTYGICEMSNKLIPRPRLEALPFTRYTVECQAELEKNNHHKRYRQPVTSLFGSSDDEDDDNSSDSKD